MRKESGNPRTYAYCRANSATGPGSHLPSRPQPRKEMPDDVVDNGLEDLDFYDEILGSISALQEDVLQLSEMSRNMFQRLLDPQDAPRQGPTGRKRRARSYSPYPSPPSQRQPARRVAYQRMPSGRMGVRSIQSGFRALPAQHQFEPEIEDDEGDMEDEEKYRRGCGMPRPMYMAGQTMNMSYPGEEDGSKFGQAYQDHLDHSIAQDPHQDGMYHAHRQHQAFLGASSGLGQPHAMDQRQVSADAITSRHTPHAMGGFMLPPRPPSVQNAHRQSARQPVAVMAPDMTPLSSTPTHRAGSSLFSGGPAPSIAPYHEPQNHQAQQHSYHQRHSSLGLEQANSITVDTSGSSAKAAHQEQDEQDTRSSSSQA
jgi:hypothetical protein